MTHGSEEGQAQHRFRLSRRVLARGLDGRGRPSPAGGIRRFDDQSRPNRGGFHARPRLGDRGRRA
eukprot:6275353-Lingulodinium_polyedra.AAC.1